MHIFKLQLEGGQAKQLWGTRPHCLLTHSETGTLSGECSAGDGGQRRELLATYVKCALHALKNWCRLVKRPLEETVAREGSCGRHVLNVPQTHLTFGAGWWRGLWRRRWPGTWPRC